MNTPPPYQLRAREQDEVSRWPLFLFIASLIFHVVIFYTLHEMPEPEREYELVVYEVALDEPEPEPKKEPEPEPEEEEEPEPEPEEEPEIPPEPEDIPPPKQEPPKKQPKKQPPPSDEPPPPPRFTLPDSQMVPSGSGSPVAVNPGGTTTSPGRLKGSPKGKPGGKPKSTGVGTGGTGKAPTGPTWAPKSDYYIRKMPLPKKRPPKLQCPASRDKGVYGIVVLSLDVRRDGTVKRVKVIRGIGSGCDDIAKKAVKKMTLTPAVDTKGKQADYANLRYEYEFKPPG